MPRRGRAAGRAIIASRNKRPARPCGPRNARRVCGGTCGCKVGGVHAVILVSWVAGRLPMDPGGGSVHTPELLQQWLRSRAPLLPQ